MNGKTKIEWADRVWNPVVGCTPASAGCAHCYAKRIYERFYQERPLSQVQLHPERLDDPLHWRYPSRVLVNSMSDLFHYEVSYDFIADIVETIALSPKHTFMVLTKRPKRMQFIFSEVMKILADNPLPNLWLGVTVENQQAADERIPLLLQTPAAVRFVSVEPMLGPVDLGNYLCLTHSKGGLTLGNYLDWVICGGETGPGARPMHPDWVVSLRDQCVNANVPFFFKSWGDWEPAYVSMGLNAKYRVFTFPDRETMYRVGKKTAGRILDGEEWNEFPEVEK